MMKVGSVFYGWVIVGISTLVFAIVRGVNDSFSVFFVALLEEFGWGRAAVAGVFSCARLTEATISLAVGMLSDRFGLRRLVPISACLVALGLVLASQAQTLWMLYIAYGCIFAIGYCGLGELSHVPLISRWFVKKRGTAIGIAGVNGAAILANCAPPIQALLPDDLVAGRRQGYCISYRTWPRLTSLFGKPPGQIGPTPIPRW